MKRYACILLALLFAGCAASRRSAVATAPQEKQYAVILSMDAFRWDLAGRSHTPTLDSLVIFTNPISAVLFTWHPPHSSREN